MNARREGAVAQLRPPCQIGPASRERLANKPWRSATRVLKIQLRARDPRIDEVLKGAKPVEQPRRRGMHVAERKRHLDVGLEHLERQNAEIEAAIAALRAHPK